MAMMRVVFAWFVFFNLFACAKKPDQVAGERWFVTAISGLRVRAERSLTANTLALAPAGASVRVEEQSPDAIEIDGLRGHWVRVTFDGPGGPITGWVFSGYLSRTAPTGGERVASRDGKFYYTLSRTSGKPATPDGCAEMYGGHDCVLNIYTAAGKVLTTATGTGPYGWFDNERVWVYDYFGDCGGGGLSYQLLRASSGALEPVFKYEMSAPCGDNESTGPSTHTLCLRQACVNIETRPTDPQTVVSVNGRVLFQEQGESVECCHVIDLARPPTILPDRFAVTLNGRQRVFVLRGGKLEEAK